MVEDLPQLFPNPCAALPTSKDPVHAGGEHKGLPDAEGSKRLDNALTTQSLSDIPVANGKAAHSGSHTTTKSRSQYAVQAHDDGIAFFNRFVDDTVGKTCTFFAGAIAYNRAIDAFSKEKPRLPVLRQESILRDHLAEWKSRLLKGPPDEKGRHYWQRGLETVQTLSERIVVDEAKNLIRFARAGWDENKSPALSYLIQGRNPGEVWGMESILMALFEGIQDPQAEDMTQVIGRRKTTNPAPIHPSYP
ncbi:hypothetical protein BKA70DRAFT_1226650 [Coprinopsis sp. MPI-PUGE-AT-0042]|nr:hypothetical protein BKA70DRAFT_1226650 [Coprinopsis sp. MPI-PUGE-AT-0042]